MTAPSAAGRVLCADDQPDVLEALRLLLKSEGFEVVTAATPGEAAALADETVLDAAFVDMNYARDTTSGAEGLALVRKLQEIDPSLPVVVMTAWGTVDGAVEAMRIGARDYVQKPWENARLLATLRAQVTLGRALRTTRRLEDEASRARGARLPEMVAGAPAMQAIIKVIERVGPSDANVLITGPHGAGKDVVARYIHAVSRRSDKPFIAINAGGLADGVFDSELFGHVRGAFTDAKADRPGCFELAEGGTLFLDEIANMPMGQQAKLLRVLQTGEYRPVGSSRVRHADVRVLTATNVDVAKEVTEQRFREDLLYRLNTVELALPSLAERREDIPVLAERFLAKQIARYGKKIVGFTAEARTALAAHGWPGNVRELEHVIERAVLMCEGAAVDAGDLLLKPTKGGGQSFDGLTLEEVERRLIERALVRLGNVTDAARALGLSRSALYRRLQHFGLEAP